MTESLFVYSSANVYKIAENVYPVNTNVMIDGRGQGSLSVIKIVLCDYLTVYFKVLHVGLFSDSDKPNFCLY